MHLSLVVVKHKILTYITQLKFNKYNFKDFYSLHWNKYIRMKIYNCQGWFTSSHAKYVLSTNSWARYLGMKIGE